MNIFLYQNYYFHISTENVSSLYFSNITQNYHYILHSNICIISEKNVSKKKVQLRRQKKEEKENIMLQTDQLQTLNTSETIVYFM